MDENWRMGGRFSIGYKTLTDISKYPEYAQRLKILLDIEIDDFEETPPNFEEKQFWWLNANPKIWGIDRTKIGQTQTYTSHIRLRARSSVFEKPSIYANRLTMICFKTCQIWKIANHFETIRVVFSG